MPLGEDTMDEIKIDLDEGRIFVDGEWLSEEELKYAIKTKISSDDFDIEHLARAMKTLEKIMGESSMMEVRITNAMHKKLKESAEDMGESIGTIVRKALEGYLGGDFSVAPSEDTGKKRAKVEREPEPEEEDELEPEPEPEPEPEEEEEDEEEDDELFNKHESKPESEPEEDDGDKGDDEDEEEDDLDIEHISRRRRRSRRR
ncbi:MAG: hypothetical protein QCI38_02250 [Candidatus Thermoplasmatota archaeon]|nr:hypothetical protein [Candidatus Thermoplasmatota archaeon]